MVTSPSNCQNNTLNLGDIFTPHRWCKYFIEEFNLLNQWIAGKIIFDPTMGTANILESFVDLALEKGHQIRELPLNTLLGVEINSAYHAMAIDKFKRKYNVDMSLNFKNEDILNCSEIKCDTFVSG